MTFSILGVSACDKKAPTEQDSGQKAPGDAKKATQTFPEKGAIAHVAVGKFLAGSRPGEPGRDPALEPMQAERQLGPFRIDALPYPGDPNAPPRMGVTAEEANVLCAERGARLCTEFEWERACRGPGSSVYPSGSEPCSDPKAPCQSGFDVFQMTSLPEWTASTFGSDSEHRGAAVTRGAPPDLPAKERRCARRTVTEKDERDQVGFRCCYGAPNAAAFPEPKLGPPYEEVDIDKAELKKLLLGHERTKELAKGEVTLFKPEAARTVLDRGPGETLGFTLTTRAVKWQPTRGSEYLVVVGRSGERTSFVLVYHVAPDGKSLAGSFIMENEPGPIALAYAESIRPRIHFSGCWGCPGETGKVLFRPPEELVLLQP